MPVPDGRSSSPPGSSPALVRGLDVGGWLAWCLAGLDVFGGGMPTMRHAKTKARRVVAAIAMARAKGNITLASKALGISRRALRELLRATGLYPWKHPPAGLSVPEAPASSPTTTSSPVLAANQDPRTPPRCPCAFMATQEVIEDGSKGTVRLGLVSEDNDWGPASLERDGCSVPLFGGWWVHLETARDYAKTHGHEFHAGA